MGILRARWRSLPIAIATLMVMDVAAGTVALLGGIDPVSEDAPIAVDFGLAALAFGFALLLLLLGARMPKWALLGNTIVAIVAASAMIAGARSPGGELLAGFVLTWVTVYVTLHHSRRNARLWATAATAGVTIGVLIARHDGGVTIWFVITATIWLVVSVVGGLVKRLHAQAETDALTGTLNRAGFERAARREQAIARRTGTPPTLVLIDLDGFKAVNDRDGHAAGDRVLIELADAWRSALRPGDLLGRHGGDEFVVLLPATAPRDATAIVARLAAAHDFAWTHGLEPWPADEPLQACMARADRRLYDAKAAAV
ncbi:GGDEF domain-containing protein [Conexibacter sp. JD483]|uniref:GGDEF domain-containing protein n=1 Tax=unclassified Conexibacter TaxID=2627773 RepID=UPI00272286BF|nr:MULTISPECIES: GGDEF domain-containing protein [unclassified Conexibacter]MDO8185638.1 GGDEF domain-containing protein [Conexibacter sp. CPCC 205706]MDO8198811.1 GGDEF domain-containing protein [Conexibacter sp. CPCC 205762]MDR9367839.1 GGDEF domain-containing protein [Conexibacter sp. JD483]